jgi:hypothetical protein
MLFAGLAASAAVDLLSLLQPEKPKKGGAGSAQASFNLPEVGANETASAQSTVGATGGQGGMSSNALATLLSVQGQNQSQAHAAHQKKHSISVLLNLLQSSQDGSVTKADFATALGGEDDKKASEMFDRLDQNHDSSVNAAEVTNFIEIYRRNAEAGPAAGKGRALAVAA